MRSLNGGWLSVPVFSRNGIFFWCAGYIVRLRYTFLIISALIAAGAHRTFSGVLVWIVAVTLGVLLHELGHAFVARHYGGQPTIELYSLGGLTTWNWSKPPRWTAYVLASLAGPGIGIVFGLGLELVIRNVQFPPQLAWADLLFRDLGWVTLGWSVFNLFPILPLDGAAAIEILLSRRIGADRARHRMRIVSIVTAALVGIVAFQRGESWVGMLCVLFAYNNAQAMRGLPGIRITG